MVSMNGEVYVLPSQIKIISSLLHIQGFHYYYIHVIYNSPSIVSPKKGKGYFVIRMRWVFLSSPTIF